MMLAFDVGFEFPNVPVFLQPVGILPTAAIRRGRRLALVGIVALVAVITASGVPFSLGVLSIPMYLFYEISILVGMLVTRRRRGT